MLVVLSIDQAWCNETIRIIPAVTERWLAVARDVHNNVTSSMIASNQVRIYVMMPEAVKKSMQHKVTPIQHLVATPILKRLLPGFCEAKYTEIAGYCSAHLRPN